MTPALNQRLAAAAALLAPLLAAAHEGHGRTGTHWHDSDAWAWLLAAAAVAATLWWARRR